MKIVLVYHQVVCTLYSRKWTYCFSGNKCGSGSFFEDVDYKEAGAEIVAEQAKVWDGYGY